MHAHAVRLTPGTDLKDALERLARDRGLSAEFILTCVGSLSQARLRMPGAPGQAKVFRTYQKPMEIVSLTGPLCLDCLQIHISLSRRDGVCIGGHLVRGCLVHTTAELVIGDLTDLVFRRVEDPATGYRELRVDRRD